MDNKNKTVPLGPLHAITTNGELILSPKLCRVRHHQRLDARCLREIQGGEDSGVDSVGGTILFPLNHFKPLFQREFEVLYFE